MFAGKTLSEIEKILRNAVEAEDLDRLRAIIEEMQLRQQRAENRGRPPKSLIQHLIRDAKFSIESIKLKRLISKPRVKIHAPAPSHNPETPIHLVEYNILLGKYKNLLRVVMLPAPSLEARASNLRAEAALAALAKDFADWQKRYPPKVFPWPSTKSDGLGPPGDFSRADTSPLGLLGYHVGRTAGLNAGHRQRLLDWAFANPLPPVESTEYMLGWAMPGTAARLRRMAEHIAQSGKLRRKAFGDRDQAVQEWQADLDYLERTHYRTMMDFSWPETY